MAARTINRVTLFGYTADEPTIRTFGQNSKVANITVVTNESMRNTQTGQWEDVAEWHRVVAWGRLADVVANYVHKGQRLYVEGRLRTHSYTDNTGIKRRSTEIIANDLIFGDSRRDSGSVQTGPGDTFGGTRVADGRVPTGPNDNYGGTYSGGDYVRGGESYAGGGYSNIDRFNNRSNNRNNGPFDNHGQSNGGSNPPYGDWNNQPQMPSGPNSYSRQPIESAPQEPPYQRTDSYTPQAGNPYESPYGDNSSEAAPPAPPAPAVTNVAPAAPVPSADSGDDEIPF